MFITVFTKSRHYSLSWEKWIHSTIQRPFVMLHFNNILPSMHMSFRWFLQMRRWLHTESFQNRHPVYRFVTAWHAEFLEFVQTPSRKVTVYRFTAAACIMRALSAVLHIWTTSSHSGPHEALCAGNRGPLERSYNTAEGKVVTEAEV